MQQIQRQDDNIKMLGIIDQMTRTANDNRNTERAAALQRFERFRSLGDAKRAAEELNKAQGKGWLHKLFSNDYNKPEDFDVAGQGLASQMLGERPEVAMDDKMQVAMQAANQEMEKQGGYGTKLSQEMKTGFGPKAARLATENVQGPEQVGLSDSSLTADVDQYTSPKAAAAQKRMLQVENSQQKYDSMKMSNMQSRPLSPNAIDQYDFVKQQYDAALATGKQGLIKDAYNDMVHKFKLLDNKWGWNMSKDLKNLRPSFGGTGTGAGKSGQIWYNDLTGAVTDQHPGYEADGKTIKKGFKPQTEATFQSMTKRNEDILNDDKNYTPEQRKQARVNLDLLLGGRAKREIVTMNRDASSPGLSPLVNYRDQNSPMDTSNIAADFPANKNAPTAQPKAPKYKEGYEYEVNGVRMVYQNGRLRKL